MNATSMAPPPLVPQSKPARPQQSRPRGASQPCAESRTLDAFDIPWSLHWISKWIRRWPDFWKALGNLETRFLEDRLRQVSVEQPIFIAGLARSGTTILLEAIASHPQVATHQYRDFPMLYTPWWWGESQKNRRGSEEPVERSHGDGLQVTRQSPEAMEEVLWMAFFPDAHNPDFSQVLEATDAHPEFAAFYVDHLRKLLLLRQGSRYASKGNYNLTRIPWLARQFPDARFVIPIRQPARHVASLIKQHTLFSAAEQKHPRALEYMRTVGHFEFGLDRRPINTGSSEVTREIQHLWHSGNPVRGWARYWASLYKWVDERILSDPELRTRVTIQRFEDLCESPEAELVRLLSHCRLTATAEVTRRAHTIRAPRYYRPEFTVQELDTIREETADTAARFGYSGE